jgi:hypothetical protein
MDSSTPTLTLKTSELKLDYTPSIEQLKLVFPGAQKMLISLKQHLQTHLLINLKNYYQSVCLGAVM